jgi:hypothetical protein
MHREVGKRSRIAAVLAVSMAVSACAGPTRIVAFGDVHGDLDAMRNALRLAGAIDAEDRWVGGDLIVVQTGDQLDRGGDEQAILDFSEQLRLEADAAGGRFHALLGNHELMNVRGDLRYVTDEGFADFEDAVEFDPEDPMLAEFEPRARARMAAMLPGRPYALLMARRVVVLQVEDNVFVHGGVLPEHVQYGIDRLNRDAQDWLRGSADRPEILIGSDSPQWTRLYSQEPDSVACETLDVALSGMGAARIVMGHTIQSGGITDACGGRAWRIDVGMAAHYGGPVEVLEIVGDSVRVLRRRP